MSLETLCMAPRSISDMSALVWVMFSPKASGTSSPGAPFSSAEGCIVPVDCVRVKSAQRGSLEKLLLLGKITQPTDWTRARGTI